MPEISELSKIEKAKFAQWIAPKIQEIGGFPVFCQKLNQYGPRSIAAWVQGIQTPGYKAQLSMCAALGCTMAEIRSALGMPYSPFAELLANKILPYGKSTEFPRKTGIAKSNYQKWIAEGKLPRNAVEGDYSLALRSLRDALIAWGDPTPPDLLMQELSDAAKRTIADRKIKRKQLFNEK